MLNSPGTLQRASISCAVLAVLAGICSAQSPQYNGMECTAGSPNPPLVRAEGLAELVADVVLNCTGGVPSEPAQPVPQTTLKITFSATVTTPPIQLADEDDPGLIDFLEAVILVDEPAPDDQYFATGGVEKLAGCDPGPDCPNAFLAERCGPSCIVFRDIPFDPPGNGESTLRITNVRVNAETLDPRPRFFDDDDPSNDAFTINSCATNLLWPYVTNQAGFDTGLVISSASRDPFGVQPGSGELAAGHFGPAGVLTATERFASDFQRRHAGQSFADPFADPVPQNFPGQQLNTTSGFGTPGPTTVQTIGGETIDVLNFGITESGTRFVFDFINVPPDANLFVTGFNLDAGPGHCARLVTDRRGVGNPAPLQPNGFAELIVDPNGRTRAIYEVCDEDAAQIETYQFAVDLISSPGSVGPRQQPVIWTTGTSAPYGGDSIASVPGFQGYIIAHTEFRTAHGYGFISDIGAAKLAQGYLALILNDSVGEPEVRREHALFESRSEPQGQIREASAGGGVLQGSSDSVRFELTPTGYLPTTLTLRSSGERLTGISIEAEAESAPGPAAVSQWLIAQGNSGATPVTIDIAVNPEGLGPGTYSGNVNAVRAGDTLVSIPVELVVPPPGPRARGYGVTNAGSYASNVVSPGEAITIFGTDLGPAELVTLQLEDGKAATEIGSTRVLFDGVAAPMIFASQGQISCFVPFSVAENKFTEMVVEHEGVASPAVRLAVSDAVPGLFTADQSGGGLGAILNQDNTINFQTPAKPGEIIQVFGTGAGETTPPGQDGAVSTGQARFNLEARVFIDGREVAPEFAGPAPGLIEGVFQVNLKLPDDLRSGNVPIVIFFGDRRTQPGVYVQVE